jgi:hypothetical protein
LWHGRCASLPHQSAAPVISRFTFGLALPQRLADKPAKTPVKAYPNMAKRFRNKQGDLTYFDQGSRRDLA